MEEELKAFSDEEKNKFKFFKSHFLRAHDWHVDNVAQTVINHCSMHAHVPNDTSTLPKNVFLFSSIRKAYCDYIVWTPKCCL